jgi:aromatic ring-cleaving dioxygenase
VYAIVPAHAESNAAAVARELGGNLATGCGAAVLLADFYAHGFPVWGTAEAPQRLDGRTWGAFVTHGECFDTLEAREAHPREIGRLLEHARQQYQVVFADLTQAKEVVALEVLRQADYILVVSTSDAPSLNLVRYKAAWLRSLELDQNCGLLLHQVPDGEGAPEAEERTGLPVCALIDTPADIRQFALWLGSAETEPRRALGAA